jgi:hypothetical protein
MSTTAIPTARSCLHRPPASPGRRARRLLTALIPAALTLTLSMPAIASPNPPPSADTYRSFCSNNSDLCTGGTRADATADGYSLFCSNNSDLCTVTARNPGSSNRGRYECTLNTGPSQCPPDAVVLGGPEYTRH